MEIDCRSEGFSGGENSALNLSLCCSALCCRRLQSPSPPLRAAAVQVNSDARLNSEIWGTRWSAPGQSVAACQNPCQPPDNPSGVLLISLMQDEVSNMAGILDSNIDHARPSHEDLEHKEVKNDTPLHRVDKEAMESAKKAERTIKRHEEQNPIFTK